MSAFEHAGNTIATAKERENRKCRLLYSVSLDICRSYTLAMNTL